MANFSQRYRNLNLNIEKTLNSPLDSSFELQLQNVVKMLRKSNKTTSDSKEMLDFNPKVINNRVKFEEI